jgi:hypothetical protein
VFYTHQRVQSLKTHDEVARFLHDPGLALCVLSRADAATIARLAPGQVFELAHEQRLVVRLDRLFGDRSPYEEPLVLVSNHPRSD